MKNLIKAALVGAAVVATAANANPLKPTSTSSGQSGSDLILFVTDTTNSSYFAYDTGVKLDTVESVAGVASAFAANGNVDINQNASNGTLAFNNSGTGSTMALGTNLTAFLNTQTVTGTADSFVWAIDAGDSHTNASSTVGASRLLISSAQSQPSWATGASTGTLNASVGLLNALIGKRNTLTGYPDVSSSYGWNGPSGLAGPEGWAGSNPNDSGAALGAAQTLFLISGDGSTGANVQATSGTFTLSLVGGAAAITYTAGGGGSPVPLPGSAWLLGGGLFGLVGVARRRRA